ncbi:MAG: hypothetical protein BGO45_06305 [Microbacterium sp. 71-36]|nr:MAG: hypothetical protein BGO45_06305 [Microbacterium sp. 71-36]
MHHPGDVDNRSSGAGRHESRCACLHGPREVPGSAEGRDDEGATSGNLRAQKRRGGDAVDVTQPDRRLGRAGGLDHLVAAADLGDDLDVGLQTEQGREGTADEVRSKRC